MIALVKSFPTSIYYLVFTTKYLLAKIGFDTVENESLKVCQKIVGQLDRLGETKHKLFLCFCCPLLILAIKAYSC